MSDTDTTTIEVSTEVWAALDRRKERGESFDDVVRNLIEATGTGIGELAGSYPELEYGEVEPIEGDVWGKSCAHFDVIESETCGNKPTVKRPWNYEDEDEWDVFYFCDEHRPDEREEMVSDGE